MYNINQPFKALATVLSPLPAHSLLSLVLVSLPLVSLLQSPASILPTEFTLFILFLNPSLLLPAPASSSSPWLSLLPELPTTLFPPLRAYPANFSTRAITFLSISCDFYFFLLLPLNLFFPTSLPLPHTAGMPPLLSCPASF